MIVQAPLQLTLNNGLIKFSHSLPGNRQAVLDTVANIIDQSKIIATFDESAPVDPGLSQYRFEDIEGIASSTLSNEEATLTFADFKDRSSFTYTPLNNGPSAFLELAETLAGIEQLELPDSIEIKELVFPSSFSPNQEEFTKTQVLTLDPKINKYLLVIVTGAPINVSIPGIKNNYTLLPNSYFILSSQVPAKKERINLNLSLSSVNQGRSNPYLLIYRHTSSSEGKVNYTNYSGVIPNNLIDKANKVVKNKDGEYLLNASLPSVLSEIYKLIPFPLAKNAEVTVDIGQEREIELSLETNQFAFVALGNTDISLYHNETKLDSFSIERGGIIVIFNEKKIYTNRLKIEPSPHYSLIYY
jgi:hypothetical protein